MCHCTQPVFWWSDWLRRLDRLNDATSATCCLDHQFCGDVQRPLRSEQAPALTGVFSGGTGVITPGNLAVTSGIAVTVSPTATTTYTLTVTPTSGSAVTQTAAITVNPLPTITSFTAAPPTITVGGSSMLTAVFANGTGVITPGNIAVTSGVAVSVSPTATTTYTLTVTPPAVGTAITQTAIVTVNPVQTTPTITSFGSGPPSTITAGNSTNLTAVFAGGTGVITPGNIAVTTMVPVSVSPATTTTIHAHCYSACWSGDHGNGNRHR